mmetsp:Transcript_4289/g.10187  ORF Transcript_4289/g.10187 Transcript_4289/m.10187 type:complete len:201 (-) Transcript_4289:917-1519(-)
MSPNSRDLQVELGLRREKLLLHAWSLLHCFAGSNCCFFALKLLRQQCAGVECAIWLVLWLTWEQDRKSDGLDRKPPSFRQGKQSLSHPLAEFFSSEGAHTFLLLEHLFRQLLGPQEALNEGDFRVFQCHHGRGVLPPVLTIIFRNASTVSSRHLPEIQRFRYTPPVRTSTGVIVSLSGIEAPHPRQFDCLDLHCSLDGTL